MTIDTKLCMGNMLFTLLMAEESQSLQIRCWWTCLSVLEQSRLPLRTILMTTNAGIESFVTSMHDLIAPRKRHNLDMISIFAADGKINEEGQPFTGMMRYDARVAVEKELEKKGLLRGKEGNKMRLGICSR